jgi:hypothetical protein
MEKGDIAGDCLKKLFLLLRVILAPVITAQYAILILHRTVVWSATTLT